MRLSGFLLIAGTAYLTAALPALDDAPKLTLDELVGAGTFAPPTLSPDTTRDFGIPPNPQAIREPIKGIPLPVFDPNKKYDDLPPLINENQARFVPMPKGAFHIEFDKNHPYEDFNISKPISVDLSKYISNKFECGFCLKIVEKLKEEIAKKGAQAFTEELQKTCQSQKEIGQWQTSCELIDRVKVDRMATESTEQVCLSEKRCKGQEDIRTGGIRMDELSASQKEEDEMREKWKMENEKARQIVEAQEEAWRREFKRTHNETFGWKPLLLNLPEGYNGTLDDDWKPDFGGWTLNDTTTESTTTASLELNPENFGAEQTTAEGAETTTTASSGLSKFMVQSKPTADFLHEVLGEDVKKDEAAPSTSASAVSGDVEEKEPAAVKIAASTESAVATSTPEAEKAKEELLVSTAGVLAGLTPGAHETGPEPTTLFSTTTEAAHFTKSKEEQAGEEEARRILQETVLEAKKTVDEDVGFMSKPVVAPHREGTNWQEGPRVNLHEFVSPHHLGTASSPKSTVDAANVDATPVVAAAGVAGAAAIAAGQSIATSADAGETTIAPPIRAPIQCGPAVKKTQFSAHPTAPVVAASSDQPTETAAGAAAAVVEPEATKLEINEEQEGPAKMAIAKSRPMRIVNRIVQADMQVDDIARY